MKKPSMASVSSGNLPHPQAIRSIRNSTDLHPSGRNIDEEQHNESRQPRTSPDLHTEEIRGDNLIPMLFQELLPCRSFDSFRRRLYAVPLKNTCDGIPRHRVTQIRECALNP